jgi:hypothetical protein
MVPRIRSFAARTFGAKPGPLVISDTHKASVRRSANGGCLTSQARGNDSASPFSVEERVIVPTNSALHVLWACGRGHDCPLAPGNPILLIGTRSFAPAAQSANAAAAAHLLS